jgi:hypothetical protein
VWFRETLQKIFKASLASIGLDEKLKSFSLKETLQLTLVSVRTEEKCLEHFRPPSTKFLMFAYAKKTQSLFWDDKQNFLPILQ